MPIVDVTYDHTVTVSELRRLADLLPDIVAEAVECPEEPWTGAANVGDIEIRFRPRGAHDIGDLRVVVEVRTRRLEDRLVDRQHRSDLIRDRISGEVSGAVGVWLMLIEGAWSQT